MLPPHSLFPGERLRQRRYLQPSCVAFCPRSVSGREDTAEELSEAMMRRILCSVLVASPQSVFGREAAPEEVSTAILRRILGSPLLSLHDLSPGERIRQRSYLKPWCVAFWARFCRLLTICFSHRASHSGLRVCSLPTISTICFRATGYAGREGYAKGPLSIP